MKALGIAGVIIGIVAGVVTVWGFFDESLSPRPLDERLIGGWFSEYSYPTSGGRNEVTSVSTLFENGKYNVHGKQMFVVTKDGAELKASYELSGAGSWTSMRDTLYMTLSSLKTSLTSVTADGKTISAQAIPKSMLEAFAKLEDYLADGTTQQYQVVPTNEDEVILITTDPAGKKFEIFMQRQNVR